MFKISFVFWDFVLFLAFILSFKDFVSVFLDFGLHIKDILFGFRRSVQVRVGMFVFSKCLSFLNHAHFSVLSKHY